MVTIWPITVIQLGSCVAKAAVDEGINEWV